MKPRKTPVQFRLSSTTVDGNSVYRVQATIPGFGPAYLVKPEGDNNFPNRSAAIKACKRRAASLGYIAVIKDKVTKTTTSEKCSAR